MPLANPSRAGNGAATTSGKQSGPRDATHAIPGAAVAIINGGTGPFRRWPRQNRCYGVGACRQSARHALRSSSQSCWHSFRSSPSSSSQSSRHASLVSSHALTQSLQSSRHALRSSSQACGHSLRSSPSNSSQPSRQVRRAVSQARLHRSDGPEFPDPEPPLPGQNCPSRSHRAPRRWPSAATRPPSMWRRKSRPGLAARGAARSGQPISSSTDRSESHPRRQLLPLRVALHELAEL